MCVKCLKFGVVTFAAGMLAAVCASGSLIEPAGPRQKFNFDYQWRFMKGDVANGAATNLDDSAWPVVNAPHTYNDTDTYDDWSPSGHRGEMNQWGGRTWYRKHFAVPADWQDKKVFIEFEAARQVAEVYLNGNYLGTCSNGFLPFGFDLTPHLQFGGTNLIAVMCDNSFATDDTNGVPITWLNAGNAKIYYNNPHWHPAHGGLYRNVYLHVTDPAHITLPLYTALGSVGTYAYATDFTTNSANVAVEAEVANEYAQAKSLTLHTVVRSAEGGTVLSWDQTLAAPAESKVTFSGSGALQNPKRWEPLYPYLYTVETTLEMDGQIVDGCRTSLGIRSVIFNRYTGFFINDRHVKLQGWGQKPTDEWPGLGAAQPDWMHDFTLKLMHDAGGNFVRWGHCAGGPAQIRAANQYGIITEQPGVDGEGDTTTWWNLRASAFRDMLVYYRNSPCILIWEGGNQSVSLAHVQQLRGYVDTYDPHGGRAYSHRHTSDAMAPYCDISIGTEGSHEQPQLPVVEGEYDREEAPRRVWDRSTPPWTNYHAATNASYDLTAEQFAANETTQYKKIAGADHCGGANWIFSDSTSGGRVPSEVCRVSGEVDGVRLPKEAYYVCRVIFSDDRDLHLIGHWNYPPGTVKNIYVASDCDQVELYVNGVSQGRHAPAQITNPYLFAFTNVAWQAGTISATGYVASVAVAGMSKHTTGDAIALRVTPVVGPAGLQAGADVALFDVEAVDALGERVPTWYGRVDFDVSGPGAWRGGYNSGMTNSVNNSWLDLESGINRVAVRTALAPGILTLLATNETLGSATGMVTVLAIDPNMDVATNLPAFPAQGTLVEPPPPPPEDWTNEHATGPAAGGTNRFFSSVSYSGPSGLFTIVANPTNTMLAYPDAALAVTNLPAFLARGECLSLAQADWDYSAEDLLSFSIAEDTVLFVAHDDLLGEPGWLTNEFTRTLYSIDIAGVPLQLYRRACRKGDALTIGSNTELDYPPGGRMMMVFAPGYPNIAIYGTGSASSVQSGNWVTNANDGSPATRWAASSSSYPQYWQVDLAVTSIVSAVRIDWYNSDSRYYTYRVGASLDGVNFTTVFDASTNNRTGVRTDAFPPVAARYVRIDVLACSTSSGYASFYEAQVLLDTEGDADGDGLDNRMEYVLRTDALAPTANSGIQIGAGLEGGSLVLSYPKRNDLPDLGLSYWIEWSDDLMQWQPETGVGELLQPIPGSVFTTAASSRPVLDGHRFYRVVVNHP
jgi:beta-galactosidase